MINGIENKIKSNKLSLINLTDEQIRLKIKKLDNISNLCKSIIKFNLKRLTKFLEILNQELKGNIILLNLIKNEDIINYILIEVSLDLNSFLILYELIIKNKIYNNLLTNHNNLYNLILIYISLNDYSFNKTVMKEIKIHLEKYTYFIENKKENNLIEMNKEDLLLNNNYKNRIKRIKSIIQNTDNRFTLICFEIFLKVFINNFYLNELYILIMNLPKSNNKIQLREIFKKCYLYLDNIDFMIGIESKEIIPSNNSIKYKNLNALLNNKIIKIEEEKQIEIFQRIKIDNLIIPIEYFNKMIELNFNLIHLFQISNNYKLLNSLCFNKSKNFICEICNKIVFPIEKEDIIINKINEENIFHILTHYKEIDFNNELIINLMISYYINKGKEIEKYLNLISFKNEKTIKILIEKLYFYFKEMKINKKNGIIKYLNLICNKNILKIELILSKIIFENYELFNESEIIIISNCFCKFNLKKVISHTFNLLLINNNYNINNKENYNINDYNLTNKTFSFSSNLEIFKFDDLKKIINPILKLFKYETIESLFNEYGDILIYKLLKNNFKLCNKFEKYLSKGISELLNKSPQSFNKLDIVYKEYFKRNSFDIFVNILQNEDINEDILDFIMPDYKKDIETLIVPLLFHLKNNYNLNKCIFKGIEFLIKEIKINNKNSAYICNSIIYFFELTNCICKIHLINNNECINSLLKLLNKSFYKEIIPYLKYEEILKLDINLYNKIELLNNSKYPIALNNSIRIIIRLFINEINKSISEFCIYEFYKFLNEKSIKLNEINHLTLLFNNQKDKLKEIKTSYTFLIYENALKDIANELLKCNDMKIMDKVFYTLQEISTILEEFSLFNNLDFIVDLPNISNVCPKICCSINKEDNNNNLLNIKKKIDGFKYELKNKPNNFINEFYEDIYNFVWCRLNFHTKTKYNKLFLGSIFNKEIRNTFLFPMIYFLMEYDNNLIEYIKLYINLNCKECILIYKNNINKEIYIENKTFFGFFHKHKEIENIPIDLFLFLYELNNITNKEIVSYYDLLILSIHFKYWEHALKCLYLIDCIKNEVFYSYLILIYYFLNNIEFIEYIIKYYEVPNLLLFLDNQRLGIIRKRYLNKEELIYLGRFESFDRFSLYIKWIYKKLKKLIPFNNKKEINLTEEEIYNKIIINEPKINKILIKRKNLNMKKKYYIL